MKRLFSTILAFCLSLPPGAALTWTHGSGTCPQGNSFPDGCPSAPVGSANAPGLLLNGVGGTGTIYGSPPPWNVAGYNYRTGYPTNIVLKDPASGGFPACASVAGHTLTINSGPCTINGYDFSLEGGWNTAISNGCSGGTVTIQNNNYSFGVNFGPGSGQLVNGAGACSLDLEANVFDGNGCVYPNSSALIVYSGSGAFTAKYNQILNAAQHGISLQQAGSGNSFTSQFNYYRNVGYGIDAGAQNHGDPFIFNTAGGFTTVISKFDTIIQAANGLSGVAVGLCPANQTMFGDATSLEYLSPNTGGTLSGVVLENNTLIAYGTAGGAPGYLFVANTAGSIASASIQNNFYDVSGTFTPGTTVYNIGGIASPTIAGNKLLTNGHACNANGSCSFLLKRDLNPAANDNTPMWLNEVA